MGFQRGFRPRPAIVPREIEEEPPWVLARYPGSCSNCWWDFPAGVLIRADGEGGWIAECCDK